MKRKHTKNEKETQKKNEKHNSEEDLIIGYKGMLGIQTR